MKNNKKRILILSRTPWRDDNSFGSSFSNIFGGINDIEIANIYCGQGTPKTMVATKFFQINEKMILRNLFNKKNKVGIDLSMKTLSDFSTEQIFNKKEQKLFNYFQKNRLLIFFWVRDIIWMLGRWKTKELNNFIDDFKPDLIFLPIYYWPYMNKIGLYVKKYSGKKMVGYISDDNYTLRQYSIDPFFWIDRLMKRKFVKMAIDQCEILYVISDVQKKDYDECFNKDCKILYKGGNFNREAPEKVEMGEPIKLVFTGNIGDGRYKTLALIGKALDLINEQKQMATLYIYSQTPLSNKIKESLSCRKSISFQGAVSFSEIEKIQIKADILVHVESFQLKERLRVRHSFSTKIVDYFQAGCCIFAVGWQNAASINYLIKNDAAIVAINQNEIILKLRELINRPEIIKIYRKKAWECGKRNHEIDAIQSNLLKDIKSVIG